MISINKAILFTVAVITATIVGVTVVGAQECTSQYGGSQYGTNCNPGDLTINKEVQKIGYKDANGNAIYVDNLSLSDASASAGMYMTFRLTVKNNANRDFSDIEVKDIFPPFMSYPVSEGRGPLSYLSGGDVKSASYDPSSRTLFMRLENFKKDEERQIIVTAKVDDAKAFPSGKSNICIVNTAQVKAEGNRFDEDTAQICVSSGEVKGVSTLPKAGFNQILLGLPAGLLGLFGIKLIRNKKK
jgi:hypothetical protein